MTFTFEYDDGRKTHELFIGVFSVLSMSLVSSVIDRLCKRMDSLYQRVIFLHLLCGWMLAFLRLLIGLVINTLTNQETTGVVLLLCKYLELSFRYLGMGTHLVMVWMYAMSIYQGAKGSVWYPRTIPGAVYIVWAVFWLYPIFSIGVSAQVSVSRMYVLVNNRSSYRVAARVTDGVVLGLWASSQLSAIVLSLVAFFRFRGVLHHSPRMIRMSMALFQIMLSFALFNLPYSIYKIAAIASPRIASDDLTDILLGLKTVQGCLDAVLIYNLFFKQKDSLQRGCDPAKSGPLDF
jgi:hypothetical protein